MSEAFRVPDTVRAYLEQPAIRTAVDSLVAIKPSSLPPDLSVDELGDYLAARGTAELTRFDWATALHALWCATWQPALQGWQPVPPEDVKEEEIAVTPDACWDEEMFGLIHRKGSKKIYTAVSISTDETNIAISATDSQGNDITDLPSFRWDEPEWEEWLVSTQPINVASQGFDIEQFASIARAAIERIETL